MKLDNGASRDHRADCLRMGLSAITMLEAVVVLRLPFRDIDLSFSDIDYPHRSIDLMLNPSVNTRSNVRDFTMRPKAALISHWIAPINKIILMDGSNALEKAHDFKVIHQSSHVLGISLHTTVKIGSSQSLPPRGCEQEGNKALARKDEYRQSVAIRHRSLV
ncbi:MAG TPA: hypothetical protein VGO22_21045 [Pseudorhizobium sp.]|nr:hypothetical protein [Pseudorhizobium sp.]